MNKKTSKWISIVDMVDDEIIDVGSVWAVQEAHLCSLEYFVIKHATDLILNTLRGVRTKIK